MAVRPRPLQTLKSLENCSSHFDYEVRISHILLPPIPILTIRGYSRIYIQLCPQMLEWCLEQDGCSELGLNCLVEA